MTEGSNESPVLHTLFELCNDVAEMRSFYSEGVGLTETLFNAEHGWLTYQAGPVQIVFTEPGSALRPPLTEWSRSPGWDGGTVDEPSWVFRIAPEAFDGLVERLTGRGTATETRGSQERGLREVFVMDPMGRTVEIYSEVEAADATAND